MLQIHTYYLIATAATLTGHTTSIFFLSTLVSAVQFVSPHSALAVLHSLLTKTFSVHIIGFVHMCVICIILYHVLYPSYTNELV